MASSHLCPVRHWQIATHMSVMLSHSALHATCTCTCTCTCRSAYGARATRPCGRSGQQLRPAAEYGRAGSCGAHRARSATATTNTTSASSPTTTATTNTTACRKFSEVSGHFVRVAHIVEGGGKRNVHTKPPTLSHRHRWLLLLRHLLPRGLLLPLLRPLLLARDLLRLRLCRRFRCRLRRRLHRRLRSRRPEHRGIRRQRRLGSAPPAHRGQHGGAPLARGDSRELL